MKCIAKIKNISQTDSLISSSLGTAGIITNGIAKIDFIDFENRVIGYNSSVMAFYAGTCQEDCKTDKHSGTVRYKFEAVEYIQINDTILTLK